MNLKKLGIIISREYRNKVQKKSFIIITFLAPILFAAICILPTIIMMATKEEAKKVGVLDASGIVLPYLTDNDVTQYIDLGSVSADSAKANLSGFGVDILLTISPLDSASRSVSADCFSEKPVGMETGSLIEDRINDAVEAWRIDAYGVENLKEMVEGVKSDVKLHSYTIDAEGKETITESGIYMAISMILGMAIYLFITLFSGMVMSSVIEEKTSRVVEVLVSSVRATELMFGKIIGVALVAITQFLLWIVLTGAIIGVVGGIVGMDKLASLGSQSVEVSDMGVHPAGMDLSAVAETAAQGEPEGMEVILSTLGNLNFAEIGISFLFFFIFGYLLYASLFAAIGSAVENEGDSNQLQLPVTIPLLLGFFVAIYAFKAPDSSLVFWFSMIPFTSPIVMLARIPFGVATWELIVSIVVLILTFFASAWASAKIYKVGILMYGKKSTFSDLWKWLTQK